MGRSAGSISLLGLDGPEYEAKCESVGVGEPQVTMAPSLERVLLMLGNRSCMTAVDESDRAGLAATTDRSTSKSDSAIS